MGRTVGAGQRGRDLVHDHKLKHVFQHGINRASTSLSVLRGTSRYWGGVELVKKKKAPSPWSDHIETTLPSKVCQGSISTTASNVTKFIYESMFHKRNQENKRGDIEPEYLPRLLEYDCSGRRFSGHVRIGRRCRFVDGEPEQAGAHRSQQVQPSSPESTESTSREYIRYVIKIFCMIRSKVFIPPPPIPPTQLALYAHRTIKRNEG